MFVLSRLLVTAFIVHLSFEFGFAQSQLPLSTNPHEIRGISSAPTDIGSSLPSATKEATAALNASGRPSTDSQTGPRPPASARPTPLSPPDPGVFPFADLSFRYSGRGYRDKLFHYRLFVPVISSPLQKLPLIVWLHGLGEAGDNNVRQLRHLDSCIFESHLQRENFPFFLLAVQCPLDNPRWTTSAPDADDMVNVVLAILDQTVTDYPVDKARISVVGVSSGGTGCWELTMRDPERFSAVAPMASGGGDLLLVNRLVGLPVWAFHSARDIETPIEGDRRTVDAISRLGGRACLTEVDSDLHDCWTAAFQDYDLLRWLLYQRRGQVSNYGPGKVTLKNRLRHFGNIVLTLAASWGPWHAVLELGVPILLILGFWSAKRQRRKRLATRSNRLP